MDFCSKLHALATQDATRKVRKISLADLTVLCGQSGLALPDGGLRAVQEGVLPASLLKNMHGIDLGAQTRLLASSVLLVGAGGLGGYVLELLARFGVGRIIVADGDSFEESNLNRQLLSSCANLGRNKAICAAERAAGINPLIRVEPVEYFLDQTNADPLIRDVHVVVDALGGIAPRQALHAAATRLGKPVISAAVAGWTAIIGSERPGVVGISHMWSDQDATDAEAALGSLAPAACLSATIQAAETIQYLVSGELRLEGRMLCVDLSSFSFEMYDATSA